MKNLFNKKFIYGSGSLVLIAIFIAALVIINLIAEGAVNRFPQLRVDLTENKLYTISDETINILKELDTDINVYVFASNEAPEQVMNTLGAYQVHTDRLKVEVVNPIKNPQMVEKYDTITKPLGDGSVVFALGDNFITIAFMDLFPLNSMTQKRDYMVAESRFTSAILTVQRDTRTKVAFVTGHNEVERKGFVDLLTSENITVSTVDLSIGDIEEDTNILICISPVADFTPEEIDKVEAFLESGKAFHIYMDISDKKLTNLETFLQEWGIAFGNDVVVEGDAARVFNMQPFNIIPTLATEHTLTEKLVAGNIRLFTSLNRAIDISYTGRSGSTTEQILITSDKAYTKAVTAETLDKETDDKSGVFNLGVSSYRLINLGDNKYLYPKIIAHGSSSIVSDSLISYNKDYVLNMVTWGTDNPSTSLSIRPKSLSMGTITMTGSETSTWFIVLMIVLPLFWFVVGVIVWFRRRHL